MKDPVAIFGQRLRQTRSCHKMTREQLADKSLVSITCIRRYERGQIEPRLTNLSSLADALGVTLDYLAAVPDTPLPRKEQRTKDPVAIFGKRLRTVRIHRDLTLQQLADKSRINLNTISRYERGKYEPKLPSLIALANALDVTLDYLASKTDTNIRRSGS